MATIGTVRTRPPPETAGAIGITPMYILYGGSITRSLAPQMVLEEGSLAYTLREIDIDAGEHRGEAFLEINPAGYVPALVTPEGHVLHEAAAIMLYLADRHGPCAIWRRLSTIRCVACS